MLTAMVAFALLLGGLAAGQTCNRRREALIGSPPTCVPLFLQQADIVLSNKTHIPSRFTALSAAGNTLAVGTFVRVDVRNAVYVSGPNYVFQRAGTAWIEEAQVFQQTRRFGAGQILALSGDGNTLAVGAPALNLPGLVWVYKRTLSGRWRRQGDPLAADQSVGRIWYFGSCLALTADGTTLAVGSSHGWAWVFTSDGSQWTEAARVRVALHNPDATLAVNVALSASGDTLVVGGGLAVRAAPTVFSRTASGGYEKVAGPLRGADGVLLKCETLSLSADGLVLALGVPAPAPGGAIILTRSGNTWTQQGPAFVAVDGNGNPPQNSTQFGSALSGDGKTLVVATRRGKNQFVPEGIAVYVFVLFQGQWRQLGGRLRYEQRISLVPASPASISHNGRTVLVGLYNQSSAAVVYHRAP